MAEALRGLAISGGILIPVVVLIVVVSMAAVKRGEAMMRGGGYGAVAEVGPQGYVTATAGGAATAAQPAKTVIVTEDVSVMEILIFGIVLFTLTVLLLFGVSIISHLG